MPKFFVDVMPKVEILDPQGQAIVGAVSRLGFKGITSVRQGKRFEIETTEELNQDQLETIASTILTNEVIEYYEIHKG